MPRRDIVIVDDFYEDPLRVREYALHQLETNAYFPYGSPTWFSDRFKEWHECPFKSSDELLAKLEFLTGELVDREHWRRSFPLDKTSENLVDLVVGEELRRTPRSCRWNCTFHMKPDVGQKLGEGVHNHVTDVWNCVGPNGWVGLVYMNPDAALDTGLFLWDNVDRSRNYDWMTPPENWRLVDSIGAVFNRLVLCRGRQPHSGANGFAPTIREGRLYQTFFFETRQALETDGVRIDF